MWSSAATRRLSPSSTRWSTAATTAAPSTTVPGRGAAPLNPRAMIDATIFALLIGAVATPISWWGLSRFG
jgi:hypothetical protein